MKDRRCSLAKAMEKYGVARNTLKGFIGICELKIMDQDKFNTVVSTEREHWGELSVKDIEMRCRMPDGFTGYLSVTVQFLKFSYWSTKLSLEQRLPTSVNYLSTTPLNEN